MFSIASSNEQSAPRHRLLERIEIDDENFDRINRVIGERPHVCGIRAVREQAGVDPRIQGLYAPVEYLGKAGVLRNLGNFDTALANSFAVPPVDRMSKPSARSC